MDILISLGVRVHWRAGEYLPGVGILGELIFLILSESCSFHHFYVVLDSLGSLTCHCSYL